MSYLKNEILKKDIHISNIINIILYIINLLLIIYLIKIVFKKNNLLEKKKLDCKIDTLLIMLENNLQEFSKLKINNKLLTVSESFLEEKDFSFPFILYLLIDCFQKDKKNEIKNNFEQYKNNFNQISNLYYIENFSYYINIITEIFLFLEKDVLKIKHVTNIKQFLKENILDMIYSNDFKNRFKIFSESLKILKKEPIEDEDQTLDINQILINPLTHINNFILLNFKFIEQFKIEHKKDQIDFLKNFLSEYFFFFNFLENFEKSDSYKKNKDKDKYLSTIEKIKKDFKEFYEIIKKSIETKRQSEKKEDFLKKTENENLFEVIYLNEYEKIFKKNE